MSIEHLEEYELERFIKELKKKKGGGTELISLYIPAGRQIGEVMSMLREEYSQAGNIKSRTTRHHVQEALTSIMQRLKLFRKTPPNGLIIFCGYVAGEKPGDETLEIHLIEPPKPLKLYLYRCDSKFHTEILEEMIASKEIYGLIAMDNDEAGFALLQGRNLEILDVITSGVPSKHRAGGQSARRFQRVIEIMIHEFYKRIGERAVKYFLGDKRVEGLLIGGPGPAKEDFLNGDYIPQELKRKVIGVIDLGYSGEEGIYELVKRGESYLKNVELIKEKKAMEEFMEIMRKTPQKTAIGLEEVLRQLKLGSIYKVLLSTDTLFYKLNYKCNSCGYEKTHYIKSDELFQFKINLRCNKCGSTDLKIEEEDITDHIIHEVKMQKIKLQFISPNTGEGEALKKTFGGIVAILKYEVHY